MRRVIVTDRVAMEPTTGMFDPGSISARVLEAARGSVATSVTILVDGWEPLTRDLQGWARSVGFQLRYISSSRTRADPYQLWVDFLLDRIDPADDVVVIDDRYLSVDTRVSHVRSITR